ncbi:MAG: hypothetical protein WCC11_07610 [Gammaproteobacteria bacterium]
MKRSHDVFGYRRLIFGLSLLVLSAHAYAVSGQLLPNPNPNAQDNYYGNAVALSPDGSIAVIAANAGGYGFTTPPSVSIFQYANAAWGATPIITICDPVANTTCTSDSAPTDLFGSTVAISRISGNSFALIVGSPGGGEVNGSSVTFGVAYIYQCTVSPAACGAPVATIADPATSPSASDNFGSAVAISADGNSILVGAWGTPEPGGSVGTGNQPDEGIAHVYRNAGNNNWTLTMSLLDPAPTCGSFGGPPPQIICDEFGYAVSLSADGSTALVGAPGAVESNSGTLEPGEGQAFIFQNIGALLTTFTNTNTVACSDVVYLRCDEFGLAVALSADGSTAVVGAPNAFVTGTNGSVAGEYGLVSLYHQSTGSWSGVTSPVITYSNPNQNTNDDFTGVGGFGSSLALSSDGTTELVGLPAAAEGTNSGGYGGSGEMDSYTCSFSSSSACVNTPVQTFVDPVVLLYPNKSPEPADFFGAAVAISGDTSVLLAGAPDSNLYGANDNGAAYVYGAPGVFPPVALQLSYTGPNNVSVVPGQDLIYDMTVTNTNSTQAAVNVVLTGTLAAGVTLVSYSAAGATCIGGNGSYACTLASLGPGATWTPAVTLEVSSADAGQTVIVAAVNVKAQNSNNNPSISASVTVTAATTTTNLSLTYDNLSGICTTLGECPNADAGESFLYIITVYNSGSVAANNVVVTVTIPPGMTFTNPKATPGICLIDVAEAKMACALSTLASSANWVISFAATVNSNDSYGQILTSQAAATSSIGSTPMKSYTVTVGTPIGASGGIGWLELLTLAGLCWLGRRRLAQ